MQADFFRLAYLNIRGGFYADADDKCIRPLEKLLRKDVQITLVQEDFACIGNNFLGTIPGHPIIKQAFNHNAAEFLSVRQ